MVGEGGRRRRDREWTDGEGDGSAEEGASFRFCLILKKVADDRHNLQRAEEQSTTMLAMQKRSLGRRLKLGVRG